MKNVSHVSENVHGILRGWLPIARAIGCSEPTAKKLAAESGLPVQLHADGKPTTTRAALQHWATGGKK